MTPSDRQGAGAADAELLAVVYAEATEAAEQHFTADDGRCMCGAEATFGHVDMEACRAALAAAGRVLAERLRSEAREHEERSNAAGSVGRMLAHSEEAKRLTAFARRIAAWCGVPEGAGGGER